MNTTTDVLTLRVAETFGNTFQGEGPFTGRRAFFIRLGLCNLDCSWCDTPETWDSTRFDLVDTCPPVEVSTIVQRVMDDPATLVVITGGEPLLHQNTPAYDELVHALASKRRQVHVETNGTIPPRETCEHCLDGSSFPVAWYSVSVKLNNSGVRLTKRLKETAINAFADLAASGRAGFKFVCQTSADVHEVAALVHAFDLDPDWIWIMPEGTTAAEIIDRHRQLSPFILVHGFHTTTRLHTLLYDDEKGR